MRTKIGSLAGRTAAVFVAAALASLAVGTASASASAGTAPGDPPSTLRAGHQLVAWTKADRLQSPNGQFVLYVGPGEFVLDQFAALTDAHGQPDSAGTDVWARDDNGRFIVNGGDRTVLRLQSNGKLVLRTEKGRLVWSDRVAAGPGSVLSVTSGGNLVVRDRHGVARWASHTNAIFLPPGSRLASGHRLYDRWDDHMHPPVVTTLTMGRDGNLVKRCNTHIVWRSRTHSPGAYLSMERSGDLVIRSTGGRVVWHTRTNHAGPMTFFDIRSMQIRQETSEDLATRWAAHIPYDAPC